MRTTAPRTTTIVQKSILSRKRRPNWRRPSREASGVRHARPSHTCAERSSRTAPEVSRGRHGPGGEHDRDDDRGSCRACLRRRSDRGPPGRQRRAPGIRGRRSSSRCSGSGHRSSRRVGLGDRARARRPAARGAGRSRATSRAVGVDAPCLPSGTLSRPSFATPEGVAKWWVRTATGHARLKALRRWPRPAFDLRDHRLHQLLVVAYSPVGHPGVDNRLGMFVTAVRNGFDGRWCLLEATLQP